MKKFILTACSDSPSLENKIIIDEVIGYLKKENEDVEVSRYLYQKQGDQTVSMGKKKAQELNSFYNDPATDIIFDISGGDLANGVLPYLDYDLIKNSKIMFCGYSDLTTVLNGIYAMTGREGMLYQIRNIVRDRSGQQKRKFNSWLRGDSIELMKFPYEFVQGDHMKGIVIGGNIRCFLKLAGTRYFPDLTDKILLLEALGGRENQMISFLNQLEALGAFKKAAGILLGTFTAMEQECSYTSMKDLVLAYTDKSLPVAVTGKIGHGADSAAVILGKEYNL